MTLKLAVLGNLTIDEIVRNGDIRYAPGGSALYVSAAAGFLGARVRIVSNIGLDYPSETLGWLRTREFDLRVVRRANQFSTRFRIVYRNGSRQLQLLQRGGDLKSDMIGDRLQAIHLGPVFREISQRVVAYARKSCRFLSLDLQGLVRSRKGDGTISLVSRRLNSILRLCDLVKASGEEIAAQMSTSDPLDAAERTLGQGPGYVLVSLGREGSILAMRLGQKFRIPSYPESQVVDPTGAGDVLVGGWLTTYLLTEDPVWAACAGSALASMVVRRQGLSKFRLSREDLFRRAAWVYKNAKVLA